QMISGVADVDVGTMRAQSRKVGRRLQVGSAYQKAQVDQHLGDAAHAGTTDAHQVYPARAMHQMLSLRSRGHTATSRQALATASAAAPRARLRALRERVSSCARLASPRKIGRASCRERVWRSE